MKSIFSRAATAAGAIAATALAALAIVVTSACGGPRGPQALQQTLEIHGGLEFAHYIVSFKALAGGKAPAELERHVVAFEWQSVGGLVVPAKFNFHAYDPETIVGERLASVGIENVEFSKSKPDQALFQKPEGATVDASHK